MDSPAPLMAEYIDYDALCAGFVTWKGRGADRDARVGVWIAKTFGIWARRFDLCLILKEKVVRYTY